MAYLSIILVIICENGSKIENIRELSRWQSIVA
jgi:hypothetical protein